MTFIRSYKLLTKDRWSHSCMACGKCWTSKKEQPVHDCPDGGIPKTECKYLGLATGETVTIECKCAKKTTTSTLNIHQCGLFGTALPAYKCNKKAVSERMVNGPENVPVACRQCEKFSLRGPVVPVKRREQAGRSDKIDLNKGTR
jgi:hypothetical protein